MSYPSSDLAAGAVTVRGAHATDAPVLAQFNLEMARETESKSLNLQTVTKGVRNLLRNPTAGFYLVAELGGEMVGALMVTSEWSDWRNGTFWWIQSVFVRPDYRRRGIFRALYGHVLNLATDRADICGLRLYVERNNQTAQSTYAALGMQKTHYELFECEF